MARADLETLADGAALWPFGFDSCRMPNHVRAFYECPDCGATWSSDWTCATDEECPACDAKNISPVDWTDLTSR
jgi:rubrerythrin